tara:strand:+ start:752 stop:1060 length:309 start_codon:yes stop_codon:yes gene_type:complete
LAEFSFQREVRTPSSEAYMIMELDRQVGRVDIHFTNEMVHVAIAADESLTQETIQEIIDSVDEDLVDSVGINRENFVVHVFQGRETGVFSDENEFSEDGDNH